MKLDKLLLEFTCWRNAGRKGRKVPKELRVKALELLNEYKISEILKTLGINSKTLNSWKEEHDSAVSENRNDFQSAPLRKFPKGSPDSDYRINSPKKTSVFENSNEINCEPIFIAVPTLQKERKVLAENLSLKISKGNWSVEGNISLKGWQSAIRLLEGIR